MYPRLDSYQNLICSPGDDEDKNPGSVPGRRWDDNPRQAEDETGQSAQAGDSGRTADAEQAEENWPTRLRRNEEDDRHRAAEGESYEDQADNAIFPPLHTSKTVKTPKRP